MKPLTLLLVVGVLAASGCGVAQEEDDEALGEVSSAATADLCGRTGCDIGLLAGTYVTPACPEPGQFAKLVLNSDGTYQATLVPLEPRRLPIVVSGAFQIRP